MRFSSHAIWPSLVSLLATTEALTINAQHHVAKDEACPEIRRRFVQNDSERGLVIPGALAVQCLREMPFEKNRAVSFIKEYRKYLQYQSTLEILESPPSHYPMPPAHLLGGLDDIQKKAATGFYTNQFDFDTALKELLKSAYDGHLGAEFCSYQWFEFKTDTPLVSISSNGTALPKVYTYEDALQIKENETGISAVVSINGADVTEYLVGLGAGSQDWDALYNAQFLSLASSLNSYGRSDKFNGSFTSTAGWHGAYHTLRFANGSTSIVETTAVVNSFPFHNGTSFYEHLCIPTGDLDDERSSNSSAPSLGPPAGYPEPFIKDEGNRILGFFPESKGLEETAILVVPSFWFSINDEEIIDGAANFARVAREFIHNSTSKGKKKMIIDLSGNGGGLIYSGLKLFKLFFPDQDIYSATRWRAHEAADLAGQAISSLPLFLDDIWLNWKSQVKPDQESGFKSWKDYFGPRKVLGVPSSKLMASNFSATSEPDLPISGYGSIKLDPAKPAFKAEDIIILTDGKCASTCTVFSELMKAQGVQTIAFGGRPQNGPMQGMGGVKGSQAMDLSSLSRIIKQATFTIENAVNSSDPIVAKKDLKHFRDIFPIPLQDLPLKLVDGSINLMNAFTPDNDHLPLQFKYEAAECRRFLTLDNIRKPETMWASAADAMFHGGDCVPGSTNGTGSLWPKKHTTQQTLLGLLLSFNRKLDDSV